MKKTIAEKFKDMAQLQSLDKEKTMFMNNMPAALLNLCEKNERNLTLHSILFYEISIVIFADKSNAIINTHEDIVSLNVSKKELKESIKLLKEYEKNEKPVDMFYNTNRNWTESEMDLYL